MYSSVVLSMLGEFFGFPCCLRIRLARRFDNSTRISGWVASLNLLFQDLLLKTHRVGLNYVRNHDTRKKLALLDFVSGSYLYRKFRYCSLFYFCKIFTTFLSRKWCCKSWKSQRTNANDGEGWCVLRRAIWDKIKQETFIHTFSYIQNQFLLRLPSVLFQPR